MSESKGKIRNWNVFAGDAEYKSNPALIFKENFTTKRYKNDQFLRFKFHIKSYLIAFGLFWIIFSLANWKVITFVKSFVAFCIIILSWFFTISKKDRIKGRLLLLFVEVFYGAELFSVLKDNSLGIYALLLNIPTMISNILLIYIWYHHLVISVFINLITSYVVNIWSINDVIHSFIFQLLMILISTIILGYIERTLKEYWVLYDSFKRSYNIYVYLVDKLSNPSLVVNNSGRILYQNRNAQKLNESYDKCSFYSNKTCLVNKEPRGIVKIIKPSFRNDFCQLLKNIAKSNSQSIPFPLYVGIPKETDENKDIIEGLDPGNIKINIRI